MAKVRCCTCTCAWAYLRTHDPPAGPAWVTAMVRARGTACSASTCTCASARAASAPAPAAPVPVPGTAQATRRRRRRCGTYGERVHSVGWRRQRRVGIQRRQGYGDARAGENGDWDGGECRACTGLNGGLRLGKADVVLASGENGEVGESGGGGRQTARCPSCCWTNPPRPRPHPTPPPLPPPLPLPLLHPAASSVCPVFRTSYHSDLEHFPQFV
ncbi:hypothetical protein DFH08DRAFT_82001 [Mycena albidolilacea]|uniref:Uncharacterized protein n=1 Tax=Mycena albidolilacea TaxID=1033008 RepID=A0AAD7A9N7_9AGAR|nr:hypothetical protein DFH08DRAFT_82001 [Mycena albidolilacea]